jgi:hypothetical protein
MKKLLTISVLAGVLAMSLVTGAAASTHPAQTAATPTPIPAPPVQGAKLSVVMYVDTVQGSAGNPAPTVGCSQTNLFRLGQQVVFRMWGVNVKRSGVALTPNNVKLAEVIIPGLSAPIPLAYGAHGKAPNPVVSFWAAPWKIDATYPLGVVNFVVVVTTKPDKKLHLKTITARYSQVGFAAPSQLTVTP